MRILAFISLNTQRRYAFSQQLDTHLDIVMRALIAALLMIAATPSWGAEATVTDGNTLIVNGAVFRLDGIEAPQTDQTCLDEKGAAWTCGIEARDRLRERIGKRNVRCTNRGADSTYRKRHAGECRIVGDTMSLNKWMVQQGWALNVGSSSKNRFKTDQDSAHAKRAGLWKGCFISPENLRRFTISTALLLGASCPASTDWKVREMLFPQRPAMPPGCNIKGKVVLRSQIVGYLGIYHLVGCRSHARTTPTHRWFCSEDEARAAGFRKSYTC